jgi:peptide/nickel transport system permease protein
VTRFLLKRLGLALVTLFLLSVIVFSISNVLPGDVGRAVLGPFATQESVDALNEQLGTNRSVFTQYVDWAGGILQGDLGTSLTKQVAVTELLGPALENSFKLALVAFLICIPLSILGGVIAGLRYGKLTDKTITVTGISLAAMPEFVTGILLILVFAIWLDWLPVTAQADEGASAITQVKYLLLPALTLTLVLFGYIARITRAGVIEALDSDYTRTAYLKGLPSGIVVRKHVLRNALPPTIAVVAVQIGYLVGGLVAVEVLFNYQGIGLLVYEAARQKDLPLLTAGVLVIGIVYLVVTLLADILYAALNPRIRLGAEAE